MLLHPNIKTECTVQRAFPLENEVFLNYHITEYKNKKKACEVCDMVSVVAINLHK